MEIANTIVLLIGIVILGWYQKGRIKTLESHLSAQKSILDSLKVYLDIFDPHQLQAWVKIREETIEKQDDVEIQRMRSWMEGLMQERFEAGKWIERETSAATDLMIRLLFHAPPHVRKKSISKMPNSMLKDAIKKVLDGMPKDSQILQAGWIGSASTVDGNKKE
jgi:hypothetical protein